MKFRFCGDGDCPDWVLTEIPTLTLLTSIKMKLLCGLVAEALTGSDLDFERAKRFTADAKFGDADVRGAVAALRWLLGSAVGFHRVDAEAFSSELQQLGLPREHAQAAAKVFADQAASITAHLKAKSLRVSTLEDASCSVVPSSTSSGPSSGPSVQPHLFSLGLTVRDHIADRTDHHQVTMTQPKLQELLSELRRVEAMMDS